ncbi:hypothetical protein [Terriglobus aquaticus]|uniref:Glycosyl hydrolase family 79, N-terminal domain n=1 Tax=Terriglobus aquaticus TaxID=940139 RepID=A0ABW9KH68_9BACT|nr:hypothetical protein [Terriglobus aquaticus]
MSTLTRRTFLAQTLAASATLAITAQDPTGTLPSATLRLPAGPAGPKVPHDFIGLSYEVMQLEDPTFFSPANVGLVQQFRNLSPHGVLRLGGNTSEFSWWKATPDQQPPHRVGNVNDPGEPPPTTIYAVTPEAIRNLRGFLDATSWTCIYGLNLGYGTVETDVAEATFVYETLGSRLQYFQVGNEVDLFSRHLRDKNTWNVDTYLQNWLQIARAVQKACPNASFGLPDVASDVTWLTQIAERWPSLPDKPHVTTLSHHYYAGGPPANPKLTAESLLVASPKVRQDAELTKAAADRMGLRYRMTEGNTCYQGGKPGVSDVFAAALWGAEYAFHLMQAGYSGLNLHGGSGHAQAVSVGGSLRGEALMPDPNAPHPKPFYTPIANEGTLAGSGVDGKLNGTYVLEPVGAGLKFAAAFAGCQMVPVTLESNLNVSAYAARRADGKVLVAILNKKPSQVLSLTAPNFQTLATLTGASLEAHAAQVSAVVRETSSRRSSAGQTFLLPPHFATLIVLE